MDWVYQGSAARDITESHGERMRQQQEDQLIGQLGPEASWEQVIIEADGSLISMVCNEAVGEAQGADRRKRKERNNRHSAKARLSPFGRG